MCPQCARVTGDNKVNPRLEMKDLTVDDYITIFTPFIGKQIRIIHCGNYGDAIASPTFDKTNLWLYENGFKSVTVMTNGSARNTEWWANLAKLGTYVVFSIDGLEDTNHIYRVNSNFKKIIENIKAFVGAGGLARWDYIMFDHNKHQVDEARQLSKDLGMDAFNLKITSRFVSEQKDTVDNKNLIQVKDIKNNALKRDYNNIVSEYDSFDNYVRATPITCKYKDMKRYYIDFNMRLWPCCWVGAPGLFHSENEQSVDLKRVTDKFGEDFNRLDLHGWDNVLSHEFYNSYLENSWVNENRIYTCGRTCGDKYEFSSGYGKNTNIK